MKKTNSSTFRCTGVYSANIMSLVMTDQALHICQSHLGIRQSRWYLSTYVWVWGSTRESRAYLPDWSSTAYSPISFVDYNTLGDIEYLCQHIRGIATPFAGLWLNFRCSGESWAYLCDRSSTAYSPIPFGNQNRLGDSEYLCKNMKHGLAYSWQNRSFYCPIMEVLVHLWSASQRVGSWDTAQVFLAQIELFATRVFLA